MTDQDQSSVNDKVSASETLPARGLARRRLAKAGLGGAGVVATLAARSSLACTACTSPSGFLSGNVSHHAPSNVCDGVSPGYWKNHTGWPSGYTHNTRFGSVFPCRVGSPYANATFYQLLSHQSFDTNNLGMHLVAAILNSAMGWTPFLPHATIVAMFTEWQSQGYFTPTANVKWYAPDIVNYLTLTQS